MGLHFLLDYTLGFPDPAQEESVGVDNHFSTHTHIRPFTGGRERLRRYRVSCSLSRISLLDAGSAVTPHAGAPFAPRVRTRSPGNRPLTGSLPPPRLPFPCRGLGGGSTTCLASRAIAFAHA